MAAWADMDGWDRQEAVGQQREIDGELGPNEWYDRSQPEPVVSLFRETLDRLIDRVIGEAA